MKKQLKQFVVIIEKDDDVGMYVGEIPGIPGCHSQGKTIDELIRNMVEVLELCLEEKKEEDIAVMPKFVGVQQIEVSV